MKKKKIIQIQTMDKIVFTNAETDTKFTALTEFDQWVHVPARVGDGECYRGNLSGIDPQAAARYVRWGGNLIEAKEEASSETVATK